jgi:hypothetical protein
MTTPLDLCSEFPQLEERGLELFEQLGRLVSVQGWRADWQHGDRPAPVFDELGDRQVGHVRQAVWLLVLSPPVALYQVFSDGCEHPHAPRFSPRSPQAQGQGQGVRATCRRRGRPGKPIWGPPFSPRRRTVHSPIVQIVQPVPPTGFSPGPVLHILPAPLGVGVCPLATSGEGEGGRPQEAGSPAFRVRLSISQLDPS